MGTFNNFISRIISALSSKIAIILSSEVSIKNTVRVNLIFTAIISNLSIFGVWIILSSIKGELLPIPESIIILYTAANGIALTGKTAEKIQEQKQNTTDNTEQTDIKQNNTEQTDTKQVL